MSNAATEQEQKDAAQRASSAVKPSKEGRLAATRYVVLGLTGDRWERLETLPAATAEHAIRQQADTQAKTAQYDAYVAVPERSWRPVKVKTETRTVLKLETA